MLARLTGTTVCLVTLFAAFAVTPAPAAQWRASFTPSAGAFTPSRRAREPLVAASWCEPIGESWMGPEGGACVATDQPIGPVGVWRWPLQGPPPVVLRGFEPPPQPWMAGHRGVDLGAGAGAIVVAAGSGVVRFAGVVVDRPVVSISHADGLITTYEPVEPLVKTGDTVVIGQPIGRLLAGHAGCALACLHWGLRDGQSYLDPLALLGRAQ